MARILIVDDHQGIRAMLAMRLGLMDHEVDEADNGAVGLEMARKGGYDIILLDMHMPVMDGRTVILTLRQEGYRGLVAAVTASAAVSDTKRALDAGCDDYILKPIGDDFEDRIANLLSKRGIY